MPVPRRGRRLGGKPDGARPARQACVAQAQIEHGCHPPPDGGDRPAVDAPAVEDEAEVDEGHPRIFSDELGEAAQNR